MVLSKTQGKTIMESSQFWLSVLAGKPQGVDRQALIERHHEHPPG
jgi:hypothetical protein